MIGLLIFVGLALAVQLFTGLTFDPSQHFTRGRPSPMNLVRRDAEPEIFWAIIAIQAVITGVLLLFIAFGTKR